MNIAFVSSSVSRKGGGVTEVKRRLSQSLNSFHNVDIQIFGLYDNQCEKDTYLWAPFKPITYKVIGPSAIGFAPDLLPALKESDADLIHLHGLWQYPSYAVYKSAKPYITTIHGMLDKWAVQNSGLKKKIATTLYERASLKHAICLQAFTWREYHDIRKFGLKNPVCIIPNGVDLPNDSDTEALKKEDPVWKNIITPGKKVLLYLGRIHPKKGLVNLIEAWKRVCGEGAGLHQWNLVIAGWDQGSHEEELKQLINHSKLQGSIHFIGPQFGKNRELSFTHADAFILPSYSEGLPMAVLEAWSFNLPVLITTQCNLPEGFESGAAIMIKPKTENIIQGLLSLTKLSEDDLTIMGTAGKTLVKQKFNWLNVSEQIYNVYQWVLNKSQKPETVILK